MTNIVIFPLVTDKDMSADAILQVALGKMSDVVIVGFDKDGEEWFSSNKADAATVLYHLDRARHRLMRIVDQMTGEPS